MKSAQPLRKIPSMTELLSSPPLKRLAQRVGHAAVATGVRGVLDELRAELRANATAGPLPPTAELVARIAQRIAASQRPKLRPVINATGVLLHTGLGRAPLAAEAIDALAEIARGYCNLEFDLASGQRSVRTDAVADLLLELTGAEASLVVNNNAAATLLALSALAAGREVIVSRGQLIEIGGSYRLPDVMAASGAILREVGTTNKTHPDDYRRAIGEQTAALLRVHTSNFRVVGFTSEVAIAELARIGHDHRLPVVDDIGSGAILGIDRYGCSHEPLARASLAAGADLALMSGDKLLGGPQCGILVGRKDLLTLITKHPLARAVRVGKLTLAALEATLRLYRDEATAHHAIPLLRLLATTTEELQERAQRLAVQLAACPAVAAADVVTDTAYLGGGSVPTQQLPTQCVALTPAAGNVDQLAATLRTGDPAVVGRIAQGRLLLDLRTVFPGQDQELLAAIAAIDV
jgi:L-seryl-tRNA(Ser) seleniumtransferase